MILFNTSALLPGDIAHVRSQTSYGKMIRMTLGSYGNHDGMFVQKDGQWYVAEAVSPVSRLTTLSEYSKEIRNGLIVRVYRFPGISLPDRSRVAQEFLDHHIGIPYPKSAVRLWIFRIVNSLPYKIEGQWCTRLVWESYQSIDQDIWVPPDGRRKKNPTPRTMENRLVAGVIRDVTEGIVLH